MSLVVITLGHTFMKLQIESKYSINICSTVASLYIPLRHEEKMQDFFYD